MCMYVWSGVCVPSPPPPPHGMVWCGWGGGWRTGWWGDAGGVALSGDGHASPSQAVFPTNVARAPVLIDLNLYTLNPTPNPKPCLNAGSKPKAEHTRQSSLSPSTRSLIPFYCKPKTHKLKLNPKPQNPTTTRQGEEGPHTPHHRGGGPHPISGPLTFGGREGGGRGARDHVCLYVCV